MVVMTNKDFLPEICFFTLAVLLSSCILWRPGPAPQSMAGTIQVIGNHPFEKLALYTEDGSTFVIRASKQLCDEMMLLQGRTIIVQYTTIQRSDGMDEMNVVEFKTVHQ